MPALPQPTAQGRSATLALPSPGEDSFGQQAFQGVVRLGQTIQQVGEKIQAQQDQLDLASMAADYSIGMDAITAKVAREPDISTHASRFAEETSALHQTILEKNPTASRTVQRTFSAHATKEYARGHIDLAHHGQEIRANRAVADFTSTQQALTSRAALEPDPEKAGQHLALLDGLRNNMVTSGLIRATDAQKSKDAAMDSYWMTVAQARPQELLDIANQPLEGGENIAGMDPSKKQTYINTAISTLHSQQVQATEAEKQAEKAIKATQEANASELRATMLEGGQVMHLVPAMLRSRELDHSQVGPLLELQANMLKVPDMATYQRGAAAQLEATLSAAKYDNLPLAPHVEQNLVSAFNQGHILKDEFQHLMGLVRDVQAHKTEGNADRNRDITHAHTNMEHDLRTTGPADKFDALSEQTLVSANQFFWRRMKQDPNADPWKIAKEAQDIFKPVIERRLGISGKDKQSLDDAQMQALKHSKAISPATYKAYQDKRVSEKQWAAAQEALKNLPPPPAPGLLERFKNLFPKGKAEAAEPKPKGKK